MTERRKMITIQIARAAAIVLGVLFVVVGILRGEPKEILAKAIRICLECIGIG